MTTHFGWGHGLNMRKYNPLLNEFLIFSRKSGKAKYIGITGKLNLRSTAKVYSTLCKYNNEKSVHLAV